MDIGQEITVELYVNTLAPGMLLKGDCYDENGKKYIDASKPVSRQEIDALISSGVKKIVYKTSRISVKNKVASNIISDQTIGKALNVLEDIEYQLTTNKLNVPSRELRNVVDSFIGDIRDNEKSYLNLLDVSNLDEYTYSHSINVSTMSIMMGIALNFEASKLYNLGISGLLLDIGKSMIPKEILFKKEALTPDEKKLIRNHPVYGYNMLKGDLSMNKEILDGVLCHHENYLGGGYPLGLTRDKMSYVPQILAITDTFDAGTSNRPYRDSLTFTKIISYIMENSGKRFNPIFAQIFLNQMIKKLFDKPLYPEGCYVLLNTGEIAYVVGFVSDPFTLRPIVSIIFNPNGKDKVLKYHQQIHLEKDNNRSIIRRIDDRESVEKLVRLECKGEAVCIDERHAGMRDETSEPVKINPEDD